MKTEPKTEMRATVPVSSSMDKEQEREKHTREEKKERKDNKYKIKRTKNYAPFIKD